MIVKLILTVLVAISGYSNERRKISERLQRIDRTRAIEHAKASKKVEHIDYVRMKLFAIEKDAKVLADAIGAITKNCKDVGEIAPIESCIGRLNETVQTAEYRDFELGQLLFSSHYQEIQSENLDRELGLDQLIRDARKNFRDFVSIGSTLRSDLGVKLARLRYEKELAKAKANGEKGKRDVMCRLAPIQLKNELNSAKLHVAKAEIQSNPYSLIAAEHRVRGVLDSVESLNVICPDRQKQLEEIKSRAAAELKAIPGSDRRNELALELCERLRGQISGELKTKCEQKSFTPAVLYSLDRISRKASR